MKVQIVAETLAGALAVVFLTGGLTAQTSADGAPVDLAARPALGPTGFPVELSGVTFTDRRHLDLQLVVTPPSGTAQPITLLAKANPDTGVFTVTFPDTKIPGRYVVTATAPDGRGSGTASFTIADPPSMGVAGADALGSIVDTISVMVTDGLAAARVARGLEGEAILTTLLQLKPTVQQLGADVTQLGKDLSTARGLALPLPKRGEILTAVGGWVTQSTRDASTVRARLGAERGNDLPTMCDRLELADAGVQAAAALFRSATSGIGTLQQLAGTSSNVRSPLRTLRGRISHVRDTFAVLQQRLPPTLFARLLGHRCTVYSGSVDATANLQFGSNGRAWWTSDIKLTGRLVLHFSRNAPADLPVRVTGYIEGTGSKFSFWEDALAVQPLPRGFTLEARKRVVPEMAGPFLCPIEGELDGNTIRFKVRSSAVDFSDKVQNVMLLAATQAPSSSPLIRRFYFPVQKAGWIFDRGTMASPELHVQTAGGVSTIEQTITRDAAASGDMKAGFVIKFSARSNGS